MCASYFCWNLRTMYRLSGENALNVMLWSRPRIPEQVVFQNMRIPVQNPISGKHLQISPRLVLKKCPKLNLPKGMDTVSKLVYKDNIPITAVAKSEALQSMFRELGFGSVTYHSMNKALDEKYHCIVSKLKSIIESRPSAL